MCLTRYLWLLFVENVYNFRTLVLSHSAGWPDHTSHQDQHRRAASAVFRLVLIIPILSPAHNPISIALSGKYTVSWLAAVIEPAIPSNILMYPPRFVPFHYDKERNICFGLQVHILFCWVIRKVHEFYLLIQIHPSCKSICKARQKGVSYHRAVINLQLWSRRSSHPSFLHSIDYRQGWVHSILVRGCEIGATRYIEI